MLNMLPSILILGLAALGAIVLSRIRRSPADRVSERQMASRVLGLATVSQAVHFTEEAATGFHEQLPALFGLEPIPYASFVAFNLVWLMIWALSIPGIRASHSVAFFAAWFLAIAGIINGVAHPLLAIAQEGYFPGVVSSPFVAIACIWLWLQLWKATRSNEEFK